MFFFNSKYLSEKLVINSAKWKRWTREFLQPDPLGGYQSGFARQFSHKEAFRVYLGGHLVGEQRFSVPEARQILRDLDHWLKKNGFYEPPSKNRATPSKGIYILITRTTAGKMLYTIRCLVERKMDRIGKRSEEHYEIELLGATGDLLVEAGSINMRILMIDELHRHFIQRVDDEALTLT